ncbi:MAG TPA: hypothetical protein VJQ82_11355 [Terriglobales bacterium]|nr:hypothetical protein [Terriglobales bacterium]
MSESWEKGQKQVELPNPELNPLQNPTLGRNLGRWAQVYFTSPPERREQAVVDLLRELKSETDADLPVLDEPAPPPARSAVPTPVPKVICGTCQQPNEIGHKFCGLCGASLPGVRSERETPAATMPPRREPSILNLEPVVESPYERDDHLEWLREKSLSRTEEEDESSGTWKYGLLALAMLLGAFGVLQWVSNRPAKAPAPAVSTSTPAPVQEIQPIPATPAPQVAAPETQPATHAESAPPEVRHVPSTPARPPVTEAARTQPVTTPPEVAQPEGGAQELAFARGYLEGKHGSRDSSEAAKWLWKAVAKQNSTAGVLLSDLYRSGDGVSKSCDQARLLLVAAAKKGAPTAADKLRNIESGGCR